MPTSLLLWDSGAPGALGDGPEDRPSLTLYPCETNPTGATVIVCPGGGYGAHAPHEAEPVALWLNAIGVHAAILWYRLGPRYHHPAPMSDAQRAIRTIRARGAERGFDPARVGILGFSAGGHLASTAGTHWTTGDAASADPIERASSRPDLMVLVYPVISLLSEPHRGSTDNLLGSPASEDLLRVLSNEDQVTHETPPAFLTHGMDDAVVPVTHSLLFVDALRGSGVDCEAHLFEHGAHGYGLGGSHPQLSQWPKLCEAWLRARGF
jgi:acetyl esterase/lipase